MSFLLDRTGNYGAIMAFTLTRNYNQPIENSRNRHADFRQLFTELDNPRERAVEIYRAVEDCGFPTDILVSTVARFDCYRNIPNTVYWPASREGLILYERNA